MKKIATLLVLLTFMIVSAWGQDKMETLKIIWPEEYKWKIASKQENESLRMIELIPEKDQLENWTLIGTMMSVKGAQNLSVENVMNSLFDQAKKKSSLAELTLIEEGESPWILFKIETPKFNTDPNPESQLYYLVQGQSLYINFIAVKEKKLSDEFLTKWTKVFKSSELVYE